MTTTFEKITNQADRVDELSWNTPDKWDWNKKSIEFVNPEFGSLGSILKLFKGQLIGWMGASKEGKTTFLFQLLLYMAKRFDRKAIIFSPEHDMMYNAESMKNMSGGEKMLIMNNFVFIEPQEGVMTTKMLLDKIDEVIYDRKGDKMDITDVVVDPMNSVFNESEQMLGYNERLPLLRKYKKAAQIYGVTWHFTEHAKTKNRYQGKYLKLGDPDDYVSGREIHNSVDAFMTVNRERISMPKVNLDGTLSDIPVKTNIAEICNLGSKYQHAYKEGYIQAAYDLNNMCYVFGDEAAPTNIPTVFEMRGNVSIPMNIFKQKKMIEPSRLPYKDDEEEPNF